MSCTITPNARRIETSARSDRAAPTVASTVTPKILRSGESEQTIATIATAARIGTDASATDRWSARANHTVRRGYDDTPPEADLLFKKAHVHPRGDPDPTRHSAEERVRDGRNEVTPPFRAVAKEVLPRERKAGAIRHQAGGRPPDESHARKSQQRERSDCDAEPAARVQHESCAGEPVDTDRDRRDDHGNQAAVEVRQRDRDGRERQERDRTHTCLVHAAPQREQLQGQPLRLRDVR